MVVEIAYIGVDTDFYGLLDCYEVSVIFIQKCVGMGPGVLFLSFKDLRGFLPQF